VAQRLCLSSSITATCWSRSSAVARRNRRPTIPTQWPCR
jgi:hypothetical protein